MGHQSQSQMPGNCTNVPQMHKTQPLRKSMQIKPEQTTNTTVRKRSRQSKHGTIIRRNQHDIPTRRNPLNVRKLRRRLFRKYDGHHRQPNYFVKTPRTIRPQQVLGNGRFRKFNQYNYRTDGEGHRSKG